MKRYAHNFFELKALVIESIQNGSIFDLDNTHWLTHNTDLHIADVYINKDREVIARTYNHTKDSINHRVLGVIS